MKVDIYKTPSFCAKHINTVKVGRKNENSEYDQVKVSFVQIEPKNKNDLKAMEEVSDHWVSDKFANNMYQKVREINKGSSYYKYDKIYALTSQMDDFKHLDSDKILGLVDVKDIFGHKHGYIEHIQVNPDYIYSSTPPYRGSGHAMLNSLKKLFNKLTAIPLRSKSVIDFYKRNDFVEYQLGSNEYIWYKDVLYK